MRRLFSPILPMLILLAACLPAGGGEGGLHKVADPSSARYYSVAVFTFDNLTGSDDHDWIGTGFAESLTAKLGSVDRLILSDRRELAGFAKVAKIRQRKISEKNAAEIAKLKGCDYLVFGAVQAAGNVNAVGAPLRVTARMVEVKTGQIFKAIQLDGTMSDIFDMQSRLALEFTELMKIDTSVVEKNAMKYHGTSSLIAYQHYCLGLQLLDEKRFIDAITEFREAGAKHPGILYAEAHYALGTAYLLSGRNREMLKEFKKDVANLSSIWFDLGVACERAGKYEKAIDAFKTFVKYTDRRFAPWKHNSLQQCEGFDFVGTENGRIVAFGPKGISCLGNANGQLLWQAAVDIDGGTPACASDSICVVDKGGSAICIDPADGKRKWAFSPYGDKCISIIILGEQRRAIAVTAAHNMVCLDLDSGKPVWNQKLDSAIAGCGLLDNFVWVIGEKGGYNSFKLDDGEPLRQKSSSGNAVSLSFGSEFAYAISDGGMLLTLSLNDGKVKWLKNTDDGKFTQACPIGSNCLALTADNRIACYDSTGKELWKCSPEMKLDRLLDPGRGIAAALSGNDYIILNPDTGAVQTRKHATGKINSIRYDGSRLMVLSGCAVISAYKYSPVGDTPYDRDGYLHIADILQKMGKNESALDAYRFVLCSVDPHCAQAMHCMADIYKELGDAELAMLMQKRAQKTRAAMQ